MALLEDSSQRQERVLVTVRIRPTVNPSERSAWTTDSRVLTFVGAAPSNGGPSDGGTNSAWVYDRVFGEGSTEQEVFEESGALGCIQGTLQGFNSIVFAYGQTGAGKTHTMAALMRLATSQLFAHIKATPSRDFLLRMVVRDMLEPVGGGSQGGASGTGTVQGAARDMGTGAGMGPGLKVMEDPEQGGTWVEGLREEGVLSAAHLIKLISDLEGRRQVRDTRMNQSSSRSHLIVRITVESRPSAHQAPSGGAAGAAAQTDPAGVPTVPHAAGAGPSDAVVVSTISFVDLAGSERLNQASSGAVSALGGDVTEVEREKTRQKEASSINRSLLTLSSVIRALGAEPGARKHVPYRDSKLTRILQPSLAGNARMAIIVTISPAAACADNTRAALHFANAARRVVMMPKVNEVHSSQTLIRRMQAEIDMLRTQVTANRWQEVLEAKEEEVRRAGEHAAMLQRRLQNFERLILHGGTLAAGGSTHRARHSFDGSSIDLSAVSSWWQHADAAAQEGQRAGNSAAGVGAGAADSQTSRSLRASWSAGSGAGAGTPAATASTANHQQRIPTSGRNQRGEAVSAGGAKGPVRPSGAGQGSKAAAGHMAASSAGVACKTPSPASGRAASSQLVSGGLQGQPQWLLLDYFLAPRVRKAASQGGIGPPPGTPPSRIPSMGGAAGARGPPPVPKLNLTKLAIQKLEAPCGAEVDAALAALQAEVHCISSTAAATGLLTGALAPPPPTTQPPQHRAPGTGGAEGGKSSPSHMASADAAEACADSQQAAAATTHAAMSDMGTDQSTAPVQFVSSGVADASTADASGPQLRAVLGGTEGGRNVSGSGVEASRLHQLQQQLAALEADMETEGDEGVGADVHTPQPHSAFLSQPQPSVPSIALLQAAAGSPACGELEARRALVAALRSEVARLCSLRDAKARASAALLRMAGNRTTQDPDHVEDEEGDPSFNALPEWMMQVYLAHKQDEREATRSTSFDTGLDTDLEPGGQGISWHARPPASGAARARYGAMAGGAASAAGEESGGAGGGTEESGNGVCGGAGTDDDEGSTCTSSCVVVRAGGRKAGGVAGGTPQQHKLGPAGVDVGHSGDAGCGLEPAGSMTPCSKGPGRRQGGPQAEGPATDEARTASLDGTSTAAGAGMCGGGSGATPSVGSAATLHQADQRWDSHRVRQVLHDQKAEVTHWYKSELRRLRAEVVGSSAADVAALRDALEQYKEATERLEVQKKLLLHQVLRLELALEEQGAACAELQAANQQLTAEKEQVGFEIIQAKLAARAASAAAVIAQREADAQQYADTLESEHGANFNRQMSMFDAGDDGWEAKDTPESLTPRIIELWHELSVPLAYRSRFYLGFMSKELFWFEMEHRRLEWKRSQLAAGGPNSAAYRELQRAGRNLDWERKGLAAALRHQLTDAQREVLYATWAIDPMSKERKLQLVHKLWEPSTLSQADGVQRSAQLVVMLMGMDVTEQTMELVFGMQPAETPVANPKGGLGSVVSNIVQRLASPRGRRSPGTPGAGAAPSPSLASSGDTAMQAPNSARSVGSAAQPLAPGQLPAAGHTPTASSGKSATPRRGSGTFGGLLAGRLSFMRGAPAGQDAAVDSILSTAHVARVSFQRPAA